MATSTTTTRSGGQSAWEETHVESSVSPQAQPRGSRDNANLLNSTAIMRYES